MTYLSGKAHKKNQTIRYVFYGVIFLVAMTSWIFLKSKLYPILEPVIVRYASTKKIIGTVPEFFSTYVTARKNIVARDKELEITIERLENELAEKDGKLKEFGGIATLFGDAKDVSSTLVMYPLMRDITKMYSTILLSKGYKDGVEKDAYVYVRGLQPVCTIKEVYTSTSLCQLLSAEGLETEAVVISTSTATSSLSLTLIGRGGGTFLGNVPRDTPIAIGDDVFLKSNQTMKLGKVVDVMHNNQDTSWRVFVSGEYNPVTSSIFYFHKQ